MAESVNIISFQFIGHKRIAAKSKPSCAKGTMDLNTNRVFISDALPLYGKLRVSFYGVGNYKIYQK
jgi:hypothetical protein